ncbi:MAG: DUF4153 domain-containing protein [Tissierellia bacterium]|nr:DUF4153 domain-containing protein [Tissierellia bacterium]
MNQPNTSKHTEHSLSHRLRKEGDIFLRSFKRFPLAMASAILAAVFFIALTQMEPADGAREVQFTSLFLTAILGFFAALDCYLWVEYLSRSENRRPLFIAAAWLAALAVLVQIYFRLKGTQGLFNPVGAYIRYFLLLFALGLGAFFAGRLEQEQDYQNYVLDLLAGITTAFFYAGVLTAGLLLIYLSLSTLFGLTAPTAIPSIMAICFIPFMAGVFLSRFPQSWVKYRDEIPNIIGSIIGYVVIPVFLLYTFILYVYLGQLILLNNLPDTAIVSLVLWPQLVAVLVLFMSAKLKTTFIQNFYRYFPILSLPLQVLMYYAIYLRIHQYGITENRYIVVLLGIFLSFATLNFIFNQRRHHMILPQVLSLLFFIAALGGPLSVEQMSFNSQRNRLEKILLANEMLKDNAIVRNKKISDKDKVQITEILSYLVSNHKVSSLTFLNNDFTIDSMEKVFGFQPAYGIPGGTMADSVSYAMEANEVLDIAGYTQIVRIDDGNNSPPGFTVTRMDDKIQISRQMDGETLGLATVDVGDIMEKIMALEAAGVNIKPQDLEITGEGGGLAYRIILRDAYFPDPNQGAKDGYVNLLLLTRPSEKQTKEGKLD